MEPRIASALDELGAEDRALVELAEVRGIGDDEMAGYLGVPPEEATERRRAALERLAVALGVSSEQARAELSDALPPENARGSPAPARPRVPPEGPIPQRARARPLAPTRERSSRESRRRRSAKLFAALGVVLLAGAITVALATRGDNDGGDRSAAAEGGQAATPAGPKVELTAPGGGPGKGTAQVLKGGQRLAVTVSDLPDPGDSRYAVWLYDSVLKARQIASADRGDFALEARLPGVAPRFDLLDISLEPDDGNPQHSGQSVLRVPVSELIVPAR